MSSEASRVASQRPASMGPEDAVLVRACLQQERMRRLSASGGETSGAGIYGQGVMPTIANYMAGANPAAGVRVEPKVMPGRSARRSPVLPRGWAPLTAEQQRAVLRACDEAGHLTFRLGSLTDASIDYRVYQLQNETWAGLWVATRCCTDCDGTVANRDLLGLGADSVRAVRLALDLFNADLQTRGEPWRLQVDTPAVPLGDPRRV